MPTKKTKKKVEEESEELDLEIDVDEDEENEGRLKTLEKIEKDLLKKAKANGNSITQDEIDNAFQKYDLSDDDLSGVIDFFHENKVNVINEDEEANFENGPTEADLLKGEAEDDLDDVAGIEPCAILE